MKHKRDPIYIALLAQAISECRHELKREPTPAEIDYKCNEIMDDMDAADDQE